MMGRQTGDQRQLFYLFNLEERIPSGHLLRRINPIVMGLLADLREKLAPFYSEIGRPSIDPELMLRMLMVGYCYGIRFKRSCARRSSSISPIVGSASSILMTRFRTTSRSRSIGWGVFGRATSCGIFSSGWWQRACPQAWSANAAAPRTFHGNSRNAENRNHALSRGLLMQSRPHESLVQPGHGIATFSKDSGHGNRRRQRSSSSHSKNAEGPAANQRPPPRGHREGG